MATRLVTGTHAATVIVREPGRAERNPVAANRRRRIIHVTLAAGFPIALVLLWQISSTVGWIDSRLYPSPTQIFQDGIKLVSSGKLTPDILITTKRVLYGFGMGALAGVLLGLAMGSIRWIRSLLESTLDALYVVPKLALLPIFLNMFGLGDGPKLALVAITVFFFVWISTMSAVATVPEGYKEAAACFGASRWHMFRHVLIPASLPTIFVAMRVAGGVAFLVIVAAEFIVGTNGLGYLIFSSRALFLNGQMFVGIVVIAIEGVVFAELIRWVGRSLTKWAPKENS